VPGFGSKLMLKRLAMGFSLRDVSNMSGLKQKQLRALEDEDLLRFRDKDQVADLLKAYAATLDLDEAEIQKDLDFVWSDSSTAKNYMQQEYNKSNKGKFFGENPLVGYGIAVGAAVLLLSVGGYFYWNNITGSQDPLQGQYSIASDDSVGLSSADAETPLDNVEELTGAAEQADHSTGAVLQEENTAEGDSAVSEAQATIEPTESVDVGEGSTDLPRASGTSYLLWVGLLTFLTGLFLFSFPAVTTNGRKTVVEIGVLT
jgi:cytoskeletal protein RodZ